MATVKKIPELNEFDQNRFWANVRFGGIDECWEWGGKVGSKGYGRFWLEGKEHYAHRIVYFLIHGGIPFGKFILHHCDNRSCVNHKHVYAGTQKDNTRDKDERGRGNYACGKRNGRYTRPEKTARGERNGNSKLTKIIVLDIRKRHLEGEPQNRIAKSHKISPQAVSSIVNGKRWAHV